MTRDRAVLNRFSVAVLVVLLAVLLAPRTRATGASDEPVVVGGALSVLSNPVGAAVYLDGRYAGSTPLTLEGVGAGDHRLRLAKDGYLDNARLVTVEGARAASVSVSLTRSVSRTELAEGQVGAAPVTGRAGGGGSKKKWLIIGAAAAAGGGAALYFATKNGAPTASAVTASPGGAGMAGQTVFSFSAQASDPDGDSLTYSWNFGDGTTGSGATPTKTYATPGTYTVSVSVSDGKESATAPSTTVRVGQNLTANWTGGRELEFGCAINFALNQSGSSLSGTMTFSGGCSGSVTGVTGTVNPLTHPATVTWTTPTYRFQSGDDIFPDLVMSFEGTTGSDGAVITGSLRMRQTSSQFNQSYSATYTR